MNSESSTDSDQILLNQVVGALDQSIEHLDGRTLSRLNQARHRALATPAHFRLLNAQWLKAGVIVAILFTLVNGWMMFSSPNIQTMAADDFELIIINEDYELMQDLDFFAWMIEQEHAS
ncbi:MAG: hypothetical protein WBO73_17965 [Gammaproteobacteria bacterium]|jgi:hypothetical protein